MKHLILVGAGHAHLHVLQQLELQALPHTKITLVSPPLVHRNHHFAQQRIDLAKLARRAKVTWLEDSLAHLDAKEKIITTRKGAKLPYDIISLNVGSGPASCEIPGSKEHTFLWKANTLQDHHFNSLLKAHSCAVIGNSPFALHLTLSLLEKRKQANTSGPVVWVTDGPLLPGVLGDRHQSKLKQWLTKQGVTLISEQRVQRVAAYADRQKTIYFADGSSTDVQEIVRIAEPSPHPLSKNSGLALDERGFLLTGPTLQTLLDEHIFAVGACKTYVAAPEIDRNGVHEEFEADILWRNLQKRLGGTYKKNKLRLYVPQLDRLVILYAGERRSLMIFEGLLFIGTWCRWLQQKAELQMASLPLVQTGKDDQVKQATFG
jgi:NADH dehydrogenase FAD-containing subunit